MQKILGQNAFWIINKELANLVGIEGALLLSDLIDKQEYFRLKGRLTSDGFFYNTIEDIEKDTTLTNFKQKSCIKILQEEGFIETKLTGIPAKLHFKILENKILSFLKTGFEETSKLDLKKLETNNNIYINNNNNTLSSIEDNNFSTCSIKDNNKDVCINELDTLSTCSNINKEKETVIKQIFDEKLSCECISKSTKKRCLRRASYSINGKLYCNQHSREILGIHFNNNKKKDEIENRDEVFERLWIWYGKKDAKQAAKKYFDKYIKTNYDLGLLKYALPRYIESVKDKTYLVLLRTYLSEQRYLDYKTEFDNLNKQEEVKVESKEELRDDDIKIKYKRTYDTSLENIDSSQLKDDDIKIKYKRAYDNN